MKRLFTLALSLLGACASAQTYNALWIPDTLSGNNFNLTFAESTKQFYPGTATQTAGVNGNWWGPTLFVNHGDTVHMHVTNNLPDSTTVHWHGMHLPAVMDGGPHQPIAPGQSWNPYWVMMNNAATFWYHPHFDMHAVHQITQGMGGLIIVRDQPEAALALPRHYGVDDVPLILTDRRFNSNNQFVDASYGDTLLTNGVLSASFNASAQVIRFRILNAALERSYNLGFSDNRTFYVITTDGGLVQTPAGVTRFLISAGERVEILVNCSGQQGQTVDLKAYNASLPPAIPGFEPVNFPGPLANALGARDFNLLHLVIGAATSNPITAIPSTLVTNTFWAASSAQLTRQISIIDTTLNGAPAFAMNHRFFDMNYNEYHVPLNHTEIWQITNTSVIAHPFHIHDVEFYLLTRNGAAAPAQEQGWKDVVLVKRNETVRFIAKFEDFADTAHAYMFHCHIAPHEDGGLMSQFVVSDASSGVASVASSNDVNVFPNPTSDALYVDNMTIKNVYAVNALGQTISLTNNNGMINVSKLSSGVYALKLNDSNGLQHVTRFVKQ